MESVCAGEGFYQRQTLTGSPVWDCPSNSCVPQEALHKKQLKNAQRHFICHQSSCREHLELAARYFIPDPKLEPYKETGTMEKSSNAPVRRLVPMAAAQPTRARTPDEPILRGWDFLHIFYIFQTLYVINVNFFYYYLIFVSNGLMQPYWPYILIFLPHFKVMDIFTVGWSSKTIPRICR